MILCKKATEVLYHHNLKKQNIFQKEFRFFLLWLHKSYDMAPYIIIINLIPCMFHFSVVGGSSNELL